MKKLVFLFAILFTTITMFGQDNQTTVKQESETSTNSATITQNTNGANEAYIDQLGFLENDAVVNQADGSNKLIGVSGIPSTGIDVDLNGSAMQYSVKGNANDWINGGDANKLDVLQTGGNNIFGLHQSAHLGNEAEVIQRGNNTLAAWQGHTEKPVARPFDYAIWGSNYMKVTQRGAGSNVARFSQTLYNNRAEILQDGYNNLIGGFLCSGVDENMSAFQQTWLGSDLENDGSQLNVDQIGNNNKVGLYQNVHNNATADADIYQNGNWNELAVRQNTNVLESAELDADQRGNQNTALLDQQAGVTQATKADADIIQYGGNNKLFGADPDLNILTTCAIQAGDGDLTLDLTQTGGSNQVGLYQSGTVDATATIVQTGNDIASVYQTGTTNTATVNQ